MKRRILIINCTILAILFALNIFNIVYFYNADKTEVVYEDNILKVVEIRTTEDELVWGYATGFFIDKNGTILTNRHVVYNSKQKDTYNVIQVRLANEDEWIDAQVLKVSETDDLATIKIEKNGVRFFRIGNSISNGQEIYTIGNPNGFGLSFSNGVVSSSERNVVYNDKTIKSIQTSFVINEGNSGGPVFDKNGYLLGIISFRLKDSQSNVIQGVSFALPLSTIKTFLQS